MERIGVELALIAHLHKVAQIHDAHPVADVLHHAQVMGHEYIGQVKLLLKLVQQVLTAGGVDSTIITEHVIRKTAHFTEYAALGILLCLCFRTFALSLDRRVLSQVLVSFLVPFTDETIQLFVAGRSGQISDVWLDCAGAAFGTVVFMAAGRILSRTGVKKRDKKL